MPKNFKGTNTKSVAARERRATAEADRVSKKQKDEDDEYWRDDDKQVARKQQRKAEREGKRADQLDRKKELADELEREESELVSARPSTKASGKVTQAQIRADAAARQQAALERSSTLDNADTQKRCVVVPDLLEENPNQTMAARLQAEGAVEARSVTDAIAVLALSDKPLERHPERRVRATYRSFEAYRLPQIKQENPSLRQSQIRQMLRKEWEKSLENPLNQEHATYNS